MNDGMWYQCCKQHLITSHPHVAQLELEHVLEQDPPTCAWMMQHIDLMEQQVAHMSISCASWHAHCCVLIIVPEQAQSLVATNQPPINNLAVPIILMLKWIIDMILLSQAQATSHQYPLSAPYYGHSKIIDPHMCVQAHTHTHLSVGDNIDMIMIMLRIIIITSTPSPTLHIRVWSMWEMIVRWTSSPPTSHTCTHTLASLMRGDPTLKHTPTHIMLILRIKWWGRVWEGSPLSSS